MLEFKLETNLKSVILKLTKKIYFYEIKGLK